MNDKLRELLRWSKLNKKQITESFKELKKWKPKVLDNWFHENHEKVFEEIDCLTCANCCKTTSPIFTDKDIVRIAKYLKIKPGKFIENYLHLDEEQDYVLNTSPCAFLGDDNFCSIYHVRPAACAEYPHTNRKKMTQILKLTEKNMQVCPAVVKILQKLPVKGK